MKTAFTHLFIVLAGTALVSSQVLSQTPGTLDPSFDTEGIVTLSINQFSAAFATVIQSDGKIIVVGQSNDNVPTASDLDYVVARFLPNGSLDATFGSAGVVITELNTSSGAYAVALEPGTGKIVIAGFAQVQNNNQISLFRYNSNGTTDNSFGTNGSVIENIGNNSLTRSLIVQPDGKILVGVLTDNQPSMVARFNNNGTLDASFNGNGISQFSSGWPYAVSMALQPDGKIVVGGSINGDFALGRLNADGTVDTSFGTNGVAQTVLVTDELLSAIALQPDGKIVATGTRDDGENIMLARYNTNGSLDTGFGTAGIVVDSFTAADPSDARALVIQSDGKIIVGGRSYTGTVLTPITSSCALARFSATGAVDTGFGNNGKVITDVSALAGFEAFRSLKMQQDGKLIGVGTVNAEFVVTRYLTSDSGLGLQETPTAINSVAVFPNPATDQLTVSYSLAQETEVSVHICDVSGRYIAPLVIPSSVTAGKHEQMIQLPVTLESGCYYVVVTAGNHQQTTRIVVSK